MQDYLHARADHSRRFIVVDNVFSVLAGSSYPSRVKGVLVNIDRFTIQQ